MNMEFTLLYVVTGTLDEAKKIGKYLVEKKLAACVNILPNMISIYSWNQELKEDNETVLLIKTRKSLEPKIMSLVESMHSYECPCIVGFSIESGLAKYLSWLELETKPLSKS